jgi:ubiquinone/menaquinone biosynthesis C-methylase UbiE
MVNKDNQQQEQEIKKAIRKTYSKIALQENTNNESGASASCCGPTCCSGIDEAAGSPTQAAAVVGYETTELESVPQASILGVGCGAPVKFADLQKDETVVDLGSGAGIDVFLSARKVGTEGRAIGIDFTDEMLERARRNAKEGGYTNVDFRKGDIEEAIPADENSADVVISNCVINLTTDKVKAFKEIHRILKSGGRLVISDLVSDGKTPPPKESIDLKKWSSCIDGALTKDDYIESIRKASFQNISVLEERTYLEEDTPEAGGRKLISIVVKAVK